MASWAEEAAELDTPARLTVLSLYRGRRLEGMSPASALSSVYESLTLSCVQSLLNGWTDEALVRARQCAYLVTLRQRLVIGESPALRWLRSL